MTKATQSLIEISKDVILICQNGPNAHCTMAYGLPFLVCRKQPILTCSASLDRCIECGCLSMHSCPIYKSDDELALQGPGPVILDRK